jgi:perosamine synthetase
MLSNEHVLVGEEDARLVAEALSRGEVGDAPYVEEYEKALAEFFGTDHAVACSSGTSAIVIALQGLGADGEVMVPATAPIMTPLAILAARATPVFVDVDATVPFSPDLASVEARMTAQTTAIVTVPMWGYPGAEDAIAAFAAAHGIHHVEDAAQAHGAALDGRPLGTIGAVGTFSTHKRKLMTTGEGGFCLTDDVEAARSMRSYRDFGRDEHGFGGVAGANAKLAGPLAVLGIAQLSRLSGRIKRRRRTWSAWREALDRTSGLDMVRPRAGAEVNGYSFVLRAETTSLRDRVESLLFDSGIVSDPRRYSYAAPYTRPALAAWARPCPQAESVCSTVLTLPTHEGVPDDLISTVATRLGRL